MLFSGKTPNCFAVFSGQEEETPVENRKTARLLCRFCSGIAVGLVGASTSSERKHDGAAADADCHGQEGVHRQRWPRKQSQRERLQRGDRSNLQPVLL